MVSEESKQMQVLAKLSAIYGVHLRAVNLRLVRVKQVSAGHIDVGAVNGHWHITLTTNDEPVVIAQAYCYSGNQNDLGSFLTAISAAVGWKGELGTTPEGYARECP